MAEANNRYEVLMGQKLKAFFAEREFTFPNYALFVYHLLKSNTWTDNYINDSARVLKYTGLTSSRPYIFIKRPRFDLSIKSYLDNALTYAPTHSEFTYLVCCGFIREFKTSYYDFTIEQFKEFISNYKLPKWFQRMVDKQYQFAEEANSPYIFFNYTKQGEVKKINNNSSAFKEMFDYSPTEWKTEYYKYIGLQENGLIFDGTYEQTTSIIGGYRKAAGKFVKIRQHYYFILGMIEKGILLCMNNAGKIVHFPLYMKHAFTRRTSKDIKNKFWNQLQHFVDVDYNTFMKKQIFTINWRKFNDYRSHNGAS